MDDEWEAMNVQEENRRANAHGTMRPSGFGSQGRGGPGRKTGCDNVLGARPRLVSPFPFYLCEGELEAHRDDRPMGSIISGCTAAVMGRGAHRSVAAEHFVTQ